MDKITVKNRCFVDQYGRERIFNGINVVDKGTFNGTSRSFSRSWTDSKCEKFRAHGFELMRLGFTWEAVEPEPGVYNDEYLESVRTMLDMCEQNGVYVFLDMHQDLYSGFGDGPGDGAPAWATLTGKYKYKKPRFVWAEGYFWGRAVHTAFDDFWANAVVNGRGLQDWYADMWAHVAAVLGDHPAVIGFDMLNEPFPGKDGGKVFRSIVASAVRVVLADSEFHTLKLIKDACGKQPVPKVLSHITPGIMKKVTSPANKLIYKFDTERYSPFLNKTAASIRREDKDGIFMVENSYFSNTGIPFSAPPITVGGKRDAKQAFAPHAYDMMVDTPMYKYASNDRVGAMFAEHKRSQERLGVPVVVGEWGGNSVGTEWLPHVAFILELFDLNQWSHTYWHYFEAMFETPLMGVLCRPHPVAVTGRILSYKHDRNADTFELRYEQNGEYAAPTELYLHKNAKAVTVDGKKGKVKIEKLAGSEAASVYVATGKGVHTVRVEF